MAEVFADGGVQAQEDTPAPAPPPAIQKAAPMTLNEQLKLHKETHMALQAPSLPSSPHLNHSTSPPTPPPPLPPVPRSQSLECEALLARDLFVWHREVHVLLLQPTMIEPPPHNRKD